MVREKRPDIVGGVVIELVTYRKKWVVHSDFSLLGSMKPQERDMKPYRRTYWIVALEQAGFFRPTTSDAQIRSYIPPSCSGRCRSPKGIPLAAKAYPRPM